jgi:hypothetical protein
VKEIPLVELAIATLLLLADVGCRDTKTHPAQARRDQTTARATTSVALGPGPTEVVRRYYAAIRSGQYDSAYVMWDAAGKASAQTPEQFARGFAQTAQTFVSIGDSVTIEGAAGSQYATVPVRVEAVLRNGAAQHFSGTYTLRRAMVDGATPEQQRWRIYSAHLESATPRQE